MAMALTTKFTKPSKFKFQILWNTDQRMCQTLTSLRVLSYHHYH